MYPILLQIGPFTLYSLWILFAIGILISLIVVNQLEKKKFVNLSFFADNSLLIFFTGLILARLFFVMENFNYFLASGNFWEVFYIWDKGLSLWGGVLGVFLSLFLLARKEKEDFKAWSDILITSFMAGGIFVNIGTFLDGRNSGSPTDLPWGIILESSQYAIPIHPVQIYAALYCLLIFITLYQCFNLKFFKQSGNISLLGISLYGLFRFLEEFMRGDEIDKYFNLISLPQLFSLLAFIIGIILLHRQYKKHLTENN